MIRTTFVSLAMLALASCAEGAAGAGSDGSDFVPTGGIVVASGNGARFNATRVVGPKVQISQRPDGSWGGSIYGSSGSRTPIDATFQGGQFVGSNIRLSISREAGLTTVVGSFQDRIIRFEVTAAEIRVRTGSRSENYVKLEGPGEYGGPQSVKLEGEAQSAPPTPAFALAIMGSFI
jgi:hypothetical protein